MMPSRSAMLAWTDMSCVTKMIEEPSSRCTSRIIARTPFCTTTSSAVVGSSAMMNSGRQIVASAIVDALAHPAGKLVRVSIEHRRLQPKASQMLFDRVLNSCIGFARWTKAKSTNECFTRRTGLSTFIEPCMM